MATLRFSVRPEEAGETVNTVLRRGHGCSGTLLKALRALPGGILLDGQPCALSQVVAGGETLRLRLPPEPEDGLAPLPGPLELYYEDEHLLILNKPPLLTVHPTSGCRTGTLASMVKAHTLSRGEHCRFRPVNRLDRGASGLMAVAKHPYAQERLIAQLHTPAFARQYLALCLSAPSPTSGTVTAPIGRVPGEVLRRAVRPEGKRAVTHYATLSAAPGGALVSLMLDTGRTHQIRVHMAHLGCPLAGDFLYGREDPALIPRTALHACRLALTHPVTGEALAFFCPPPEDFLRAMDCLGIPLPAGGFPASRPLQVSADGEAEERGQAARLPAGAL